jgi:hypothetical protein
VRRDGEGYRFDLGQRRREKICKWGWTGNQQTHCPTSHTVYGAAVDTVAVGDEKVAFATLFFQPSNSAGNTAVRPPAGMSSGSKVRSSWRKTRAKRLILPPPFPPFAFGRTADYAAMAAIGWLHAKRMDQTARIFFY